MIKPFFNNNITIVNSLNENKNSIINLLLSLKFKCFKSKSLTYVYRETLLILIYIFYFCSETIKSQNRIEWRMKILFSV